MTYKTIYTEVEVDVSLEDFDTQDLIDELDARGEWPTPTEANDDARELLHTIWLKRRLGNHDYQAELDRLIYSVLDKVM